MIFTSREKEVLKSLYQAGEPVTMSYIAKTVGVSARTVKKDIKNIKEQIDESKVEVKTKRGMGVWLEINDNQYLKSTILDTRDVINPVSPSDRQYWIIKQLLNLEEMTSIEELASELFVSKSTVVKDLIEVQDYLNEYGIELYKRPKHGIKLIGSEKSFRKASASILKSSTVKHGAEISSDLKDLLKDVNLNIIQEIIQDSEVEFNYILSDISFKGLLIHLGISISRIYEENLIEMERNEMELLKKENEWKIAEYIGERLSSSFELEITNSELGFITIHLVGAKLQNDIESEKISESHLEKLNRELYTELRRIIDSISKITGYNFKQDKKLFTGLFLHLRTAVKRIKNDIRLDNPFLEDIKQDYSIAYEIAVLCAEKLNNYYKLQINEDEIGYLALHFGAAMEKLQKTPIIDPKTAVIICATGIGTGQLLSTKFKRLFPDIEVKRIIPLMKAKKIIKELKPDIVLSTVPVKIDNTTVINVSPLLKKNDIKKIQNVINSGISTAAESKEKIKILNYLEEELVFFKVEENEKREIIKTMSEKLFELGYVGSDFYGSVLEREEFSSTSIGNLAAIPHPYEGHIKKPKIAVSILKEPIQWGENKTQLVFLIALDIRVKKEFEEIFSEMSELISDKKIVLKLLNCEDYNEFIRIIKKEV